MLNDSLDELVDKLRYLTGQAAPTAKPAPSLGRRISEECALVLQQALRRHPALSLLPLSRKGLMETLLREVRESSEVAPSPSSEVAQLLGWVNQAAEELEVERLGAVFASPAVAYETFTQRTLDALGLSEAPLIEQTVESLPCPWNVLFTLLSGPVFDVDFSSLKRAELRVEKATSSLIQGLQRVHSDVYDTAAWQNLIGSMEPFPIAAVRGVWHAMLYFYPTSGATVCRYLQKELAELRATWTPINKCSEEVDAKHVVSDCLRILNTFFRHLPLTFSCDLYIMFFDFITEYVQPDNMTMDTIFRVCLRRDVGELPQSMPLWMRYLSWRSTTLTGAVRRREWVRKIYTRILRTPLLDLDSAKEHFEAFVLADLHGRLPADERTNIERRFTRAKAEALEIEELLKGLHDYLPRPLQLYESSRSLSIGLSRELEAWSCWHALLGKTKRRATQDQSSDPLYYLRRRNFLRMRACCFPHQVDSWVELIYFCVHEEHVLSEKERTSHAEDAVELARQFLPHSTLMNLLVADITATHFGDCAGSFRCLRDALVYSKSLLMGVIKNPSGDVPSSDPSYGSPTHALRLLQDITIVSVNWMRMGCYQADRFHISLVARHMMHTIDFLSLTMACIRKFMKSGELHEPTAFLQPFNVFCFHWIQLEVIRNKALEIGLGVLKQWKEHLKMMITSSRGKQWNLNTCGVNDLFIEACLLLLRADASSSAIVFGILKELEGAVEAADIADGTLHYLVAQLRHRCFSLQNGEDYSWGDDQLHLKLLRPKAAPHRYDTAQFCSSLLRQAELQEVREMARLEIAKSLPNVADGKDGSALVYPEEGAWLPTDAIESDTWRAQPSLKQLRSEESGAPVTTDAPLSPLKPQRQESAFHKTSRGILSLSTTLPSLEECLSRNKPVPPVDKLDALIRALPTLTQYNPEIEEQDAKPPAISVDWILDTLAACAAIQKHNDS
ncbi:unnamed protein product [Phytomonas sp. EM1]|nr:unnamed protein product [Phytomonas sp. EM1]|eukprot:CCW60268.1 unnamed protein product [Phytomonas sp. isolate EM1]